MWAADCGHLVSDQSWTRVSILQQRNRNPIEEDAPNFENRCGFRAFHEPQLGGCQVLNIGVQGFAGSTVKKPKKGMIDHLSLQELI